MNLSEIKSVVESGKKVYWSNPNYLVVKDNLGQWFIVSQFNSHCFGLTRPDGVTMECKESDFHVLGESEGAC